MFSIVFPFCTKIEKEYLTSKQIKPIGSNYLSKRNFNLRFDKNIFILVPQQKSAPAYNPSKVQ
jgi:hypothetical protein